MKRYCLLFLSLFCAVLLLASCTAASGAELEGEHAPVASEQSIPSSGASETDESVSEDTPAEPSGETEDGDEQEENGADDAPAASEPDHSAGTSSTPESSEPGEDPTPSQVEQTTPSSGSHSHVWTLKSKTDATCTSAGQTVSTCSCGDVKTEEKSALGHALGEWKTTVSPSVSAEGKKVRTCSRCSYQETASVPKIASSLPTEYKTVLDCINAERKAAGLASLTYYTAGQAAADLRASECADQYSHTRPDGRECFTVFDDLGLSGFMCGECLGLNYSADRIVDAWMGSATHKAVLMDSQINALVLSRKGGYWALITVYA